MDKQSDSDGVATAPTNEKAASFTPGPWHVDPHYGRFVYSDEAGLFICECGTRRSYEAQANARFISVAPRMYEALKFIADRENLTFAECSVAEDIIGAARGAIAKAEGRTE